MKPKADWYEVMRWPETAAFLERLGIPRDMPLISVELKIALDEEIVLKVQTQAVDANAPDKPCQMAKVS